MSSGETRKLVASKMSLLSVLVTGQFPKFPVNRSGFGYFYLGVNDFVPRFSNGLFLVRPEAR